jgi:hypothetical protein
MRNTARACIFGAALTLMAGAALPANAAAPDISPCTNGGYVHYVDPATGQPYSNQGRCVSTVARNGQLVPVLPPLTFGGWAYNDLTDPNACRVSIFLNGAVAGATYPVTWLIGGQVVDTQSVVPGETTLVAVYQPVPVGQEVTIVIGTSGQEFSATPATNCTFG